MRIEMREIQFRFVSVIMLAVMLACLAPGAQAASGAASGLQPLAGVNGRLAPWMLDANWSGGYAGWMSFPLAQDVGYDPSIYTERQDNRTVLIHTFLSHGEPHPWFGLVRPIAFTAGKNTAIVLKYRLKLSSRMRSLQLILAGMTGRRYTAALPAGNGDHTARIDAADLHLDAPVKVVAIVLRGRLESPPKGSESAWVMERFVLHAARPRQVTLTAPLMNASVNGALVADEVVRPGSSLKIAWASSGTETRVVVIDPAGTTAMRRSLDSRAKQVLIPIGSHATPGLWRAEVMRGSAKTVFRFLVLGAAPSHGNLLLSDQRIAELSHSPRYAQLRSEIHRRATLLASKIHYSVAAGDNIASMASAPGADSAALAELLPYLELVEDYANAVAFNALDYRLNGNSAGFDAARRALLTMARWRTWSPPRFTHYGFHTYYEVGCITQRLAFGYDLIADRLTPRQRSLVAQAFWGHAIKPVVQEYFLDNRDPIAASNWMANSIGGALAAAVAVDGDVPGWDHREGPALAELEFAFQKVLHGLFPGDGSEAEPTGYENFALKGISWGVSSLARLGVQPHGTRRMLDGFWWPYYDTVRPGVELDTGDFDGHLDALTGFAWGAEHGDIPELRSFYEKGTNLNLSHGAGAGQNGHQLEELAGPLDLVCCTNPAARFPPPPASRVFPKRGSAVLRSGWGPDSTVISLRAGAWFNHEHHDEGSFQVAAFGKVLIDEAGYASYYNDPHFADYFSQAPGHNVLLVDQNPFSQMAFNGRYWAAFKHPYFSSWLLTPSIDYVAANLTTAYDGSLQSYTRSYFFLKPDILVILDRVAAAGSHRYSWLLHAPIGSKLRTSHANASIQPPGDNVSAELTTAGADPTWSVKAAPFKVSRFKILDGPRIQPQQIISLLSPAEPSARFLVGIKLNDAAVSQSQSLKSWSGKAGEGLRTTVGKSAGVVIRTGDGWIQAPGSHSVSTDGSALLWADGGTQPVWMAVQSTQVKQDDRVVFRSEAPVDVEREVASQGIALRLRSHAPNRIDIYSANAPVDVTVDGRKSTFHYQDHRILLPELAAGEHQISIH